VEHSSEPSADTLPAMLFLRYGDPLYHERNLTSARTIRDVLTGRDRKGYVRFRSTELGSRGEIPTSPRAGGDTPYHVRPMKHLLWLAWYGHEDARDLYLNWVDGWRSATMTASHGKPAGVPPGSIWYPSGEIISSLGGTWWDPHLNYYGWPSVMEHLSDAFTSAFALSADRKYIEPFFRFVELNQSGPLLSPGQETPGSPAWARAVIQHHGLGRPVSQYRVLTGDSSHDEYLKTFGTSTQRFQIDGDFDSYARHFAGAVGGLRYNFRLQTSEVIKTDRAGLGGAGVTFGAYTGAARPWKDGGLPLAAVTWDAPDPDFAAVVLHASETRLRVRLYRIGPDARLGMRVWRLRPGRYRVIAGDVTPGERPGHLRCAWDHAGAVDVLHRAERIEIDAPSRRDRIVEVRLVEPRELPARLPDLAIHERDLKLDKAKREVRVRVHNLGSAPAAISTLSVRTTLASGAVHSGGVLFDQEIVPPSRKLQPGVFETAIPLQTVETVRSIRVELDPDDSILEINEENNRAVLTVPSGL
jgi:hypothetical protein